MCVCLWLVRGCGRCQSGAQPDVHWIWHCWANGVTGMWQGSAGPKWLFRLHYPAKTLDMPSPISHFPFMVTESFTIHKWSADCTPLFAQYRLITQRCWLACAHTHEHTHTDKTSPPSPRLKIKARNWGGCRVSGTVVIIRQEASPAGIYIGTLPSDVSPPAASRQWQHLSRRRLKRQHIEGDQRYVSLAEAQISKGWGE